VAKTWRGVKAEADIAFWRPCVPEWSNKKLTCLALCG
jgi:hypothetical protein